MNVAPARGALVARYTFDDGTAEDQSGQGNDGTIVGDPSMVPGLLGAALVFDGSDDYVVVPDSLDLRVEVFTITAWIRVDATPSSDAIILEKWQNDRGYRLVVKNGAVRFIVSGGVDAQHSVQAPFSLVRNVWTTVSVTYNGSDLRLYLDGLPADQATTPTLDIVNQADLFFAGGVDPPQLFDGAVDEITIEDTPAMESTVCEAAGKVWHAQSQTCIERFLDVTTELLLGDEDHQHFGIAMVDVNDDGWIDLYYANGEENPKLPDEPVDGVCPDLDQPPPHNAGGYNTFYLNLGNGIFGPDVAPELGFNDFWNAMRHVWGDYDNDGLRDLMSHNFLVSTLYHAVAGPDSIVFEDASAPSGLEICIRSGTGASWVDLNNDGWLDMYAVQYREGPPLPN